MKNQKKLSNSKLIAYSAAAGAALAVAPNAFAAIVHETDGRSFGGEDAVNIDLKMDGNAEFNLNGQLSINTLMSSTYFNIKIERKYSGPLVFGVGEIVGSIAESELIGPNNNTPTRNDGNFYAGSTTSDSQSHYGNWDADNQIKYCGVSFYKDDGSGDKVYGWIKIQRLTKGSGKIIDWAYEDTINTPIAAGDTGPVPEPATGLALLALGAAGIAAYRRR